ncbi:MAG: dihydroneopterin aldolase [Ferruginibacter sp.]
MITISLHNLIFHSFHGVHEEEKILGNTFVVNADVSFQPDEHITAIDQTVNYVALYALIKTGMETPTALLETLVQDLAQQIHEFDKRIKSISITVEKKNPPVPNIQGSVSVNYKKEF